MLKIKVPVFGTLPDPLLWGLFYGALAALAFSPCLFFGQAYFDNDLLAQFGPWRAFLKDQLAQGHFPLWNPYLLGGQPFLADLQNLMFYPPNYLTLPFSVPYGLSLFFFLHMAWAAWGMDLWLGSLGLSGTARRFGALLFAFSGFFWLEIIHPPVLAAFAWLPWLFYRLELLAADPKPRNAFWAGLCFALLFLAGSFQVTVGAFYAGLAYFLFRHFQQEKRTSLFTFRTFLPFALFLLWGSLPLLAQLIPTMEFAGLSDRGAAYQTYDQTRGDLSVTPAILYQFFLPRLTVPEDRPMAEAVQVEDKDGAPLAANWGFLGIWAPFFLLWSFRNRDKRLLGLLACIGMTGLFICFGPYMPFYHLIWKVLPGFSLIRVPFRYLFIYVVAVCPLVAMGWEEWMSEEGSAQLSLKRFGPPLAYALVWALIGFSRPGENWRELVALGLGLAAFFIPTLAGSKTKTLAVLLWGGALVFPLLVSGWDDFKPAPAANFDYAGNSGGLVEARKALGPNRVLFFNTEMRYPIEVGGQKYALNYPQNASCALGLKNFGGYNPLLLQAKRDLSALPIQTLIRLGAIQGILTQRVHGNMPGFKPTVFRSFMLYEYQEPIQYVFAPEKITPMPDHEERLKRMGQANFDPYQETLLSNFLPREIAMILSDKPSELHYQILQDDPDEQRFTVEAGRDTLAVFAETMFPGWKAWVDGRPSTLYTVDHLLRSLVVPAGHHEIKFRFEPYWWKPIKIGLILWTLLTAGGLLLRRKTHA